MNLELAISRAGIDKIIGASHATDAQIDKARSSALRKMKKRIETRVKQLVAAELRIPQKGIADRFFSSTVKPGDDELRVWIGTWNVSPFAIGAPVPYGRPGVTGGVRSGRRNWRGAFLAQIYSSIASVWIRLRSKHYSAELYPTIRRPGDRGVSGDGSLRGRFPVVRAAVQIDYQVQAVLEKYGDEFLADFARVFAAELNYFVNVRGVPA